MSRFNLVWGCIFLFVFETISAQNSKGLRLVSHFQVEHATRVDSTGSIWNDITAWHDSIKQKEYIIAGTSDSIYFLDISTPGKIRVCDQRFGVVKGAVNRDYETYSHYAYCVADQGAAKLQIFDLSYLPDSVHLVYESDSLGTNTHSLFIEAKSKRLYRCSNKFTKPVFYYSAMDILSLENPENPTFLAHLQVPTDITGNPVFKAVHEVYVRNDTAYGSCEYAGLYVFDLRNIQQQKLIGVLSNYPSKGYCHTSWLSPDGQRIAFTDEVPTGLPAKLYDISDLGNPRFLQIFNSHPKATPHNIFWKGNYIYTSNYQDGVYIWEPKINGFVEAIAWYDTYPNRDSAYAETWTGCWGVYPFLPSGLICASDRHNGIFVLAMDSSISTGIKPQTPEIASIYPNPSRGIITWHCPFPVQHIQVSDVLGHLHWNESMQTSQEGELNLQELPTGLYFIRFSNKQTVFTIPCIIQP